MKFFIFRIIDDLWKLISAYSILNLYLTILLAFFFFKLGQDSNLDRKWSGRERERGGRQDWERFVSQDSNGAMCLYCCRPHLANLTFSKLGVSLTILSFSFCFAEFISRNSQFNSILRYISQFFISCRFEFWVYISQFWENCQFASIYIYG